MPLSAAEISIEPSGSDTTGLADILPRGEIRCLAVAIEDQDMTTLMTSAENSQFDLNVTRAASLDEVRAAIVARETDVVLVGRSAPSGTAEIVSELAQDARLLGVPVMMIADGVCDHEVANTLRAGVSDVLGAQDLSSGRLDQAVEASLQRLRGAAADQLALISNLQAENEALRRIAIRNMRLLKGQTMPLMSMSWRMMSGEQICEEDRTRYAKGLARATRNVSGLIDDTVIVAATHRAQDLEEDVDLNLVLDRILRDDLGEIANSRAHVIVKPLPVLRARAGQMHMLFEELLLTAVRNVRVGRVPEIEIGSGQDEDGNPIVWMLEKGLQLSVRKQALAVTGNLLAPASNSEVQDAHAWSLCQRLVERNHGQFKISQLADDTSRLVMRFPNRIQVHQAPVVN
ncbi:MAG: hypothetical protein AB8B85_09040 [Paracoccaceae bacterium]